MLTNKEIVDSDLAQINLGDLNDVTENLTLPTKSTSGLSKISWSSGDQTLISSSGVVTRPKFEDGSKSVVLSVTVALGEAAATKKFVAVVRRQSNAPVLAAVPDVTAQTTAGNLPRLPYYISGKYSNDAKGPLVRVIWPSPADNNDVLKTGHYKVTGTVPGTTFKPTATVTIMPAPSADKGPVRTLEPFPLGQVVLNKDDRGNDTQFMKNRDKFINTLADTNPDSFLYNFRSTFGQPQPKGATALGVWDSQDIKLRGHASGHYLSALAQAYASTSYDKNLQDNFRQKMDYMINTLYDLSQKSGKPAQEGGPSNADPTAVPPGPVKRPTILISATQACEGTTGTGV